MELRRLSICFAFAVLAVVSQSSEARHSVQRRASDYSDEVQNDGEDYAQDVDVGAGGNDTEDEEDQIYTITSKPETHKSIVGRTARLDCKISPNDGIAVVTWIKGTDVKLFQGSSKLALAKVAGGANKYDLVDGTKDLIIRDLTFNDTDTYTCKIEQSVPANVTYTLIVEQPPVITDAPIPDTTTEGVITTNDNVPRIVYFSASPPQPVEGQHVELTCSVSGVPQPSIMWGRRRFNEDSVQALSEANGEFRGSTFHMRNVTKNDSGIYYCYAVNDQFKNSTANLTLNVLGKPHVYAHRRIINTDIGVEAVLICSTHDGPHQIYWYKDEIPVYETNEFVVNVTQGAASKSTLVVIPKTDEDFGTFTCQASNEYGSHSRSIKLVQQPVIENVDFEGKKLTWTIHSHQPLEVIELYLRPLSEEGEQMLVQVPLPEANAKTYELIHVFNDEKLQGNAYEVTIKAKNSKDWSEPSEPIQVRPDEVAQQIQTASVFASGDASSVRASTFFLNTIMMYLLVRML